MMSPRKLAVVLATTVGITSLGLSITPAASAYADNEKIYNVQLTLYGGKDNDNITPDNDNPRGIAWPKDDPAYKRKTIHKLASGDGTWENPTTLAVADPAHGGPFSPGTRFYIPAVHRYFIAEDTCHECLQDWHNGKQQHVDMWAGKNATQKALNSYPANGPHTIIVNPHPGRRVDKGPLLTH